MPFKINDLNSAIWLCAQQISKKIFQICRICKYLNFRDMAIYLYKIGRVKLFLRLCQICLSANSLFIYFIAPFEHWFLSRISLGIYHEKYALENSAVTEMQN